MGTMIDVTGQVFGRLTVLRFSHKQEVGKLAWLCRCECGKEVTKLTHYLRAGKVKSCGCWLKEGRKPTHGAARRGMMTRGYRTWASMLRRCQTKGASGYAKYGAIGITVCERWQTFENFIQDMGEPVDGMSIDRLDVNGNYSPENCRWATSSQQSRNKRNTKSITYRGRTQSLADWADELGFSYCNAQTRLARGWTPEEAFTIPAISGNRLKTIRHTTSRRH